MACCGYLTYRVETTYRGQSVDEFVDDCRRVQAYCKAKEAYHLAKAAELAHRQAVNELRPSVLLGADLVELVDHDGNTLYVAYLGELYAESASTPDEAFENFDRAWMLGKDE